MALTTMGSQLDTGEVSKALARDQLHDASLQLFRDAAEKQRGREFTFVGGLLHKVREGGGSVLVVPTEWRTKFMRLAHDECGHLGGVKTVEVLKQRVWWPAMRSSVMNYCRQCPTCARFKAQTVKPAGPLKPLEIPS